MPAALHLPAETGAFHVKTAIRSEPPLLAVVKINGNFPGNALISGPPTIQGFVAVLDAARGCVLALMDSIEITARRTAATSALAARHLARKGSRNLGMVGCGLQALYHLDALLDVAPIESIRYCDPRDEAADAFGQRAQALGLRAERVKGRRSCRTWRGHRRHPDHIDTAGARALRCRAGNLRCGRRGGQPGQDELAPDLLRGSRVVVDARGPAIAGGDLGHAIRLGVISESDIHAELADIVAGRVAAQPGPDHRYVFDSTGLAVQDLAAAEMVLERARAMRGCLR